MRKVIAGLMTGMFLIGGVVIAQANLLSNGDFDELNPSLSGLTDGQWRVYDALPGVWYKGVGTAGIEVQYNSVVDAYSGNFYVELDSHGGVDTNSSMFQQVTLDAGIYDLSFMYHARTNGVDDNGIKALLLGETEPIGSISKTLNEMTQDVWEQVSWTFTIQQTGIYQLGFAAFGNDNSFGGFIDSVSLVASPVPEPTTMLLFGTGLACLAGARLRRKKN